MRRPSTVELMLLATILLWSLNLSVTKYILDNGLEPLSYATVRYALAAAIFVALTLIVERTLRVERRQLPLLMVAAVTLCLNQLAFVFALDVTTAATIGLLLGAVPIFAALFGLILGRERPTTRFWGAAAVSALGVALVAVGSGGDVSGGYAGIALGLATSATWIGSADAVTSVSKKSSIYTGYWVTRRSAADGTGWVTVDQFDYASGAGGTSIGASFTRDPASGDLYVGGFAFANASGSSTHALVRRAAAGGTSWQTVDDFQRTPGSNAWCRSITADGFGNVFPIEASEEAVHNLHGVVRRLDPPAQQAAAFSFSGTSITDAAGASTEPATGLVRDAGSLL